MDRHVHVDTQITSHLLAALNLPPIRDVAPNPPNGDRHQDRPLPLEPSTPKDAYPPLRFERNRHGTSGARPPMSRAGAVNAEKSDVPVDQSGRDTEEEVEGGNGPLPKATPSLAAKPERTDEHSQIHVDTPQSNIISPGQEFGPKATPTGQGVGRAISKSPIIQSSPSKGGSGRRARRKWTEEETNDLIKGCHIHGAGNWKKILDDPQFTFNGRSSVDLKDRFRTCFPTEYRKNAGPAEENATISDKPAGQDRTDPNRSSAKRGRSLKRTGKPTKTELEHADIVEKLGYDRHFPKVQRRERREFTEDEDLSLLKGFQTYGAAWSRIQNDPALHLSHRRSTDLRDRFRNAYPDKYESAGFKARPRQRMKLSRSPEKLHAAVKGPASSVVTPNPSITQAVKEPGGIPQRESSSLLMHGILDTNMSPEWETPEPEAASEDQSPAPGSLALDPALNDGFEGSSLEQITEEFLSVAQGTGKSDTRNNGHGTHDVVRWEDMATHPIFELEPSLTGADSLDEKPRDREPNFKRRGGDNGIQRDSNEAKRIRT